MKYPAPTGPHADFARRLLDGMERAAVTAKDIAEVTKGGTDMKSAQEKVRLWMRGERMPRDKQMRTVAKMIGVEPSELRYGEEKAGSVMPALRGEHVTEEDELALLRAYRGLQSEWAKRSLRKRAVDLLQEFGKPGVANPFGNGTQ